MFGYKVIFTKNGARARTLCKITKKLLSQQLFFILELNNHYTSDVTRRKADMSSYYTISRLATAVISGKVPEKRDNLMHMDILHRLNSKHYSIFKDRHLELVYLRYSTGAPEDYIHLIPDNLYPFRLIPERKKFLTEHLFFGLKVVNMQFAVERRIAGGKIDLTVLDETALADADLIVGHLEKDILQFRASRRHAIGQKSKAQGYVK